MTPDDHPADPALGRLRAARGFVFDMDGTLVLGDRRNHGLAPLPGALDLTRHLHSSGVPLALLTNGTTKPPREYVAALREVGFELADGSVLTPVDGAIDVLTRRGQSRVMVLGGEGLTTPMAEAGLEPLPPTGRPKVDAVLAGWYRELTWDALEAACHAVWDGAAFYSCSQSVFFATADGKTMGTSRAISAMVRTMTNCRVEVVGKPSLHVLRAAARRLRIRRLRDLAVVGDDPDLEVPLAHRAHSLAIAVATGIGTPNSFNHLPKDRRPHLSVEGVDELLELYRKQGR